VVGGDGFWSFSQQRVGEKKNFNKITIERERDTPEVKEFSYFVQLHHHHPPPPFGIPLATTHTQKVRTKESEEKLDLGRFILWQLVYG